MERDWKAEERELRVWLTTDGRRGTCPNWYPVLKEAQALCCPPWEFYALQREAEEWPVEWAGIRFWRVSLHVARSAEHRAEEERARRVQYRSGTVAGWAHETVDAVSRLTVPRSSGGGYTVAEDTLDTSNPPQSGSSVPPKPPECVNVTVNVQGVKDAAAFAQSREQIAAQVAREVERERGRE